MFGPRALRRIALVVVPLLVSCGTGPDPGSTDEPGRPTTSTESAAAASEPAAELPPYRIGQHGQVTTTNPWAVWDVAGDAYNHLVQPQAISLYAYAGPSDSLVPLLARGTPPLPEPDGESWAVTVPLRDDVRWSDGESVDAFDVAFTFETVRRLGLGGNFMNLLPVGADDRPGTDEDETREGLVAVEAVDPVTVRLRFSVQPGVALWPYRVGTAPIFAEHHWGPIAANAPDAASLYEHPGIGGPTAGGFVVGEHEPGAFVRTVADPDFWHRGTRYVAYDDGSIERTEPGGDVEILAGPAGGAVVADWTEGPHVSEVLYTSYADLTSAVLALESGDIDWLFAPVGFERGLVLDVLADPDLDVAINPVNGFQYLAFNLRRFPMSEPAFRYAVACRIDKRFMTDTVFGGSAIAADTLVPAGYTAWHSTDIVAPCAGMTEQERLEEAVRALADAGWTWETRPRWNEDLGDVDPEGAGLRGPTGAEVGNLDLIAPGPGFDPLRATYALFVEEWATELGIPLRADPTGFAVIVDRVFNPDPTFDMYILGWGVAPFPDHVFAFFRTGQDVTRGGMNTTGYSDPDFDALADAFDGTTDLGRARELVRRAEEKLARDLPYVILFTTPVIDAHRTVLEFPFTDAVGGITARLGMPTSVHVR